MSFEPGKPRPLPPRPLVACAVCGSGWFRVATLIRYDPLSALPSGVLPLRIDRTLRLWVPVLKKENGLSLRR